MKLPSHGANPAYLYEGLQLEKPRDYIDFSVNTNPLGAPAVLREKWNEWFSAINDYPDPFGKSLVHVIAEKEQVLEEQILLGNGAAEVIQMIAQYLRRKQIMIVQPAFSEYEQACRAYDCEIGYFFLENGTSFDSVQAAVQAKEADAVFICSPNNPTGIVFSQESLLSFLQQTKSSCLVILDEAFYDFAGEKSMASYLHEFPHLIILRSLTKMYAIAGLRAGYALSSPQMIEKLELFRPHWNMNALALLAAEAALKEEGFVEKTREVIAHERFEMFDFLETEGFEHTQSAVNFYLLRDPRLIDQRPLLEYLLRKGIVLRHTYNFPGLEGKWLRAAVKTASENERLRAALSQWKMEN